MKIVGNIFSVEKDTASVRLHCAASHYANFITHHPEKTFKTKCNRFMQLLYEFLIEHSQVVQEIREVWRTKFRK